MEKYIALLRGINVGGKNKVPMPELKLLFEQEGFFDVITYINSGNIIFSSDDTGEKTMKERIEFFIKRNFALEIPVAVISAKDLLSAADHAPPWWDRDQESKHNAIFVIPPVTPEEVYGQVGEIKPEYEQVGYYGRVIFWSAPLKTFSKTRWAKVVQSSAYNSITIRNANTVKKLIQLST